MSSFDSSSPNYESDSTPNPNPKWIYDVFLSFRGKDARGFTSHLCTALANCGVYAFRDDDPLSRGDEISSAVVRAIELSKISIIVFSRNYDGSTWCQKVLVKILECRKNIGQVVLPVFYDVDPSEVRSQRGFENLFRRISMEKDEELSLSAVLREVANIGGFVVQLGSRNEIEQVKNVVAHVNHILHGTDLFSINHPVAVELEDVVNGNGKASTHDVFVCYRGKDTRAFAAHLYTYLQNAGISVFRDDGLNLFGNDISVTFLQAIEKSTVYVVIFSTNFATSTWCLRELQKIMEEYKHKTKRRLVLPIFYDIESADVRHQRGSIGYALENIMSARFPEQDRLRCWRQALSDGANIAGIDMRNSRDESLVMEEIVGRVTRWLDKSTNLFVDKHLVGVESRVNNDVIPLLDNLQSKDVLLLGIWGPEGIGKTTIAKVIYNKIHRSFEGSSFLLNIGQVWEQDTSRASLQGQLLSDIYRTKAKMPNIESGKIILRQRLRCKKVLLVLDDVNELDQMNALFGSREWFGCGSRIIITTRDERLIRALEVDHVYAVKQMDENESIELFSWHAFKQASLKEDFAGLSRNIVAHCEGFPLILKVLGSYLVDRGITEWKIELEKLKRIPMNQVKKKLKLSFDSLSNGTEKEIFLDIACFFIGMMQNDVIQILSGYGISAETGIGVLVKRCLVTINQNSKLEMHPLLRDMGREIFQERSQKEPGPRMRIFDVFLSFRGEDTRASFISHLYSSLQNAGIYVFRDDDELPKGDQLSTSLPLAIEGSRISIIVFSTNYANSKWCLLELEKIMECRRTIGQTVLPVFYDVDPSEVRNQTGKFGQAFQVLLKEITVEQHKELSWRTMLREAGGISGFVVIGARNDSEEIKNVVEKVTHLLDRRALFIADHPVGIESRVQDVIQVLDRQQSKDVLLVGIWGLGGSGKTTIAKAIYNEIGGNFEGRSFLLNIRELWEQNNGQVYLQEQLLFDIYKTTNIKIHGIESGKNILKERLCHNKVLLVLDDVNKLDQLNALAASPEWFGLGSRIIITTRDEYILRKVDHVCQIKKMNETESLELFSWHAFKQASPTEDFLEISQNVIDKLGGLPLALEVQGSYLLDRSITEWNSILDQLKIKSNEEVQKKLKISFDGLSDDPHDTKKEIFLDIACFFIGMDRSDVIQILNGCGLFADNGISVLVERSLVTVDNENKLGMHDLLQDMGRTIIHEESPKFPQKRSRLWFQKDVLGVLSNHGTELVEGLTLKLPKDEAICLSTRAFENMNRLRLLQLAGVKLDGDFKHISRELRWLCCHGFPLTHIPADFYQENLVAIELEYSKLRMMWKTAQLLKELKILNVSHSHDLIRTPNFSYLPNLEKLILEDCPRLSTVSDTIGYLNKLHLINLKDCISLRELPRSIYKLKSVKTLILSGCLNIDKLEDDIEQMESLTTLMADKTAITQVPSSIVRSKSIGYISICGFEGLSHDVFPSIIQSWMSPTNNLFSIVETSAGMPSVVSTTVTNSSSHGLSYIFQDLQLSGDAESNAKNSALIVCRNQVDIYGSKNSLNSLLIQMGMGMNCEVINILKESILQKSTPICRGNCLLPGDNEPDWLTFNAEGCSVNFQVPQVNGRYLKAMMLCVVYFPSHDITTSEALKNVIIINDTKSTCEVFRREELTTFGEKKQQCIISNLESGNKVEICVVFDHEFTVKKTAAYLIYDDEPIQKKMEQCHAPDKNVIAYRGDENRFHGLPSLLRCVLISQPFWFGLAAILVWSHSRHRPHKRRD